MRQKEIRIKREIEEEREREKRGSRDVPIHVQLVTPQPNTERDIQTKRKRQTRIKRRTYKPTMSDKIA